METQPQVEGRAGNGRLHGIAAGPSTMLALASAYAEADPVQQVALVATGDGMLATWMGTAFDVYYFFNLATLLILAILMHRGSAFSRATAAWGLIAAVLMAVPSNFGTAGPVFAIASLLAWTVFAVLAGRRMLRLAEAGGRIDSPPDPPPETLSPASLQTIPGNHDGPGNVGPP